MAITSFDVVKANAFIGSGWMTQGKQFFVKPRTGSNGNDGLSPRTALKTLAGALAKCTANQNDTVYLFAEGNASADTTDYQSATLDWNKDLVHLIGVPPGPAISNRARVAWISTYVTASNLFTVSANGCVIANVSFYAGVADTHPTGCVNVTGSRNRFVRCHLAGIGHANNDIANAYSLKIDAGQENEFDECVIGLFTVARGAAANSEILFDGAAKENLFRNCRIVSQVSHATNHVLGKVADATGIDAFNYFEGCSFLYQSANYAVGATGVFSLPALTQGYILVKNCAAVSDKSGVAVKWDVNDRDKIVLVGAATPAADTADVGRLV